MGQFDVSIILVNYKTPKMTLETINSIIEKTKNLKYEIIVVDNSEDVNESKELIELIGEKANVIISDENLGFGKANNLGSKYACGKYIYFLNTDVILLNNAIFELYDFMEKNDKCGVAGSNLYRIDKKPNHSYSKYEKNLKNEKKSMSFYQGLKKRILRKRPDFNYSDMPIRIFGYVCGASLMMKKELFDKLEGFDRDIFMYAEESLLCYRLIHELGYDIYNVPASKIIHLEGGSVEKEISDLRAKLYVDGNFIYYQKLFGNDVAIKYCNAMIKNFNKKERIAKILHINIDVNNQKYKNAYINKLKGIQK